MSLTKVKINLGTQGNLSGSRSIIQSTKTLVSGSAQIASNISGSFTSTSSSIASGIAGNLSSINTLNGSGTTQGVGTSDSPTFNNITATGTLTAQEIHTEFTSASILFTSGSTQFGNSSDDVHNMTGSLNISGSLFVKDGTLTVTDNVDFNGDLDVDGTTNLDVVDIDGAVDMASTLAVADDITLANNKYYQVKATGGSAIRIAGLANDNNIYLGAIDDAGASVHIREDGSNVLSFTGGDATFAGNITQSASGNLRHSLIAGGSGEAVLLLQANNSTGDSFIRWETNATTFSMGFDNSDSDKFILSAGSDPHSNSVINIQPDGSSIAVDKPISFGGVVQLLDVAQSIDFIQSGAINFDSNGDQTGRVLTIGSNRTGDSGGTTNVTFEESGNTIFSGDGKVGIGQGSPTNSPLEVNLTQSNGTAGSSGFAHFGSNGNTDGYIQGISLGYRESNANYRKIAIAVRGRGDGATRSDLCLLVDTANDAASATLQDAKLTIDGLTGATTLRDGIRFSATNGADPTGDDHLDVPIKFAAYTEAVDSTDVSNGSVDLDLDIYRDNYLSLNALLFDSNTNVVHAGLPSDESWLKEITVFAAGGVRVYFGSSVAVGDTVKLLVAYYGNTG